MEQEYALDWLEGKVYELDPENRLLKDLSHSQAQSIIRKAESEKKRLMSFLKHLPYLQIKRCRVNGIITAYFDGLNHLLHAGKFNLQKFPSDFVGSKKALDAVLTCLQQAHSYLLERHSSNLNPETILVTNVLTAQITNSHKTQDLALLTSNPELRGLLLEEYSFVFDHGETNKTSIRKLEYWKDIILSLCCNLNVQNATEFFDNFEILLIESNFNIPVFVKYLENKVHNAIIGFDSFAEKETHLTYLHKVFNQIPLKKGRIYCIDYDDLIVTLNSWFIQEISYNSKERPAKVNNEHGLQTYDEPQKKVSKVICNLTVDQLALLFKAADQTKLISAKSLSAVFQAVAPYLSTRQKDNVSPGSMRAKSYMVEERDKDVVLNAIAKLVREIEEF